MNKESENIFISVVMICYNEEKHLERCLQAIRDQRYPRSYFEIVFVDNGSTDRSVEIATLFADVVLVRPHVNVGALRNLGAIHSKGSVLAFLDGDCEAKDNLLSMVSKLSIEYPGTVNGSSCLIPTNSHWINSVFYPGVQAGRNPTHFLSGKNFFIPASIFKRFGGFDESLTSGEDSELFLRLSKSIPIYSDSSLEVTHHGVPQSMRIFFFREVWHGLGALGSFRISFFDKPFLATVAFMMGGVAFFIGLLLIFFRGSYFIFDVAILIFIMVPIVATINRKKQIYSLSHAIQLFIIYYFYLSARSVSLWILLFGLKHRYYKNKKID